MGYKVRNCEDLGQNLKLIVLRLLSNQDLLKLLYYSDKDPLSHPDLTNLQIKEEINEKLVKIIPYIGSKEDARSIISLRVVRGINNAVNNEFKDVTFAIEVFVPITQWLLKGDNLRPFAIMGQIEKSIVGKTINGLGKIRGGNFELNFLTEEMSSYEQTFQITSYD